ncbi:MAG: diguanylate cyclase [Sulfurimonadaceae bacterium]|nr:diguanylate cyclase [Sulfurimonadaceae bacterium]
MKHLIHRVTAFIFQTKFRLKLFYLIMFLLFGTIIGAFTFAMSHQNISKHIDATLLSSGQKELQSKTESLETTVSALHQSVLAAKKSTAFQRYLSNINEREAIRQVDELFYALTVANPLISQLRYLDEAGNETIRIEREALNEIPIIIPDSHLQNKHDRYYFRETAKLADKEIWYSRIDLNIEHGKIVRPLTPTLRIATPVYHDDRFAGIVIANFFMGPVLQTLTDSSLFNVSLFDRHGHILIYRADESYNWSQYLINGSTVHNLLPEFSHITEQNNTDSCDCLSRLLEPLIPNGEGLRLALTPKEQMVAQMHQEEMRELWTIWIAILLISFPLSYLLALMPIRLSAELLETKDALANEVKVVDKYVLFTTTDKEGYITSVSSAYSQLTGFSEDELIGSKHKLVRHPDMALSVYRELWESISSGKSWQGDILNKDRSGLEFWVNVIISPQFDENGNITGYAGYGENISKKKKLEQLSITDELTGLYNRRHFNKILPLEIKRAKRDKQWLAFLLCDIDFFKQYNDTYGHQAGDDALRAVGQTLASNLQRPSDFAFRIGGEEFGVLFTAAGKEKAVHFAQQLHDRIGELHIEHKGSQAGAYLSISGGLTLINEYDGIDANYIYETADQALYTAKQEGRDRIILADL